jgi:hypothetical protein
MHKCGTTPMHYAICKHARFSLRPIVGPMQEPCIMTFMHYHRMHCEKVNCNTTTLRQLQTLLLPVLLQAVLPQPTTSPTRSSVCRPAHACHETPQQFEIARASPPPPYPPRPLHHPRSYCDPNILSGTFLCPPAPSSVPSHIRTPTFAL